MKIAWEAAALFAILAAATLSLLRAIARKKEIVEIKAIFIVLFLVFVVFFLRMYCVLTMQ